MKVKRKILALLTAIAVFGGGFAGCTDEKNKGGTNQADESSQSEKGTADKMGSGAKGRYVESDIPLPEGAGDPIGILWKEDSLVLYTLPSDETSGYQSYTYKDQSWSEPQEEAWLTDGKQRLNLEADGVYLGGDGAIYALALPNGSDIPYGNHILSASEDGRMAQDITPEELLKVDENGYTALFADLAVLKDGTLVLGSFQKNTVDFYKEGKNTFSVDGIPLSSDHQSMFAASEESIAVLTEDGKGVDFYEPDKYQKQGTLSLNQDLSDVKLVPGESKVWYLASPNGIQRITENGDMVETIMDGANGLMSTPNTGLSGFITGEEDVFYGLYRSAGGAQLKRYAFNSEVPAVQSSVLSIYGLEENQTVAQAVYEFQSAHPEVKVEYHTAVGSGESPTSDHIRNLNAELLNGSGADVLILDGLPIASYVEKGILSDLSGLVKKLVENGALENLIGNAVKKEGNVYGIPARVGVPICFGSDEEVNACQSLENLHQYVEAHPDRRLFGKTTHDLIGMTLFHGMYGELKEEDGSLDEQKLAQFLEDWMKVCEHTGTKSFEEANEMTEERWNGMDFEFYSGGFCIGEQRANLMELQGLGSTMIPYSEMDETGWNVSGYKNYYVPKVIAGVNAASGQQELAEEFVAALFTESVQKADNYDGFPVLQQALAYMCEYVETEAAADMQIGSGFTDMETGEEHKIDAGYPKREKVEELTTLMGTLDTPFLSDRIITETVTTELEHCYEGTQTPEETARAICQKVDTYLAE